ncbi:hypothetical protein OIU84_004970, partial [Salix udensis]
MATGYCSLLLNGYLGSLRGWRDAEQQRDFGAERCYRAECVVDPRGRREEARDERVMCLVWGRGHWVVESRGEGPRGKVFFGTDEGRERHTRRRVEEMSRGSGAERKETRDLSWRGRRDEGSVVVTGESEGKRR